MALALNGYHNNQECLCSSDESVDRPVMQYKLPVPVPVPVDETPDPTGPFSDFASVQSVIITGYIHTP